MPTLREFDSPSPPSELLNYLKEFLSVPGRRVRCRCMLNAARGGQWQLLSCAIEAFPDEARAPKPIPSRSYSDCVLYEEWLDLAACQTFVASIQAGRLVLGTMEIARSTPASHWHWERVTLKNFYMPSAGLVVRTQFQQNVHISQEPLISAEAPYYPNEMEAAHHWLGVGASSGYTDGRNGQIVFSLPESRAFFFALLSDNGLLEFDLGGTNCNKGGMKITGAYWEGRLIHHFCVDVENSRAKASVPDNVSRLECALIDNAGTIYDRYIEHWGQHSGLIRHRIAEGEDRLRALITTATTRGEGEEVEFKPLIRYEEGLGTKREKPKYRELVRTIVAFANAGGGSVFLGIDDNCNVIGVDLEFAKSEETGLTDDALMTYCGSLLNKLTGDVAGEIDLRISPVTVQERHIIVIEVAEGGHKPLMVRGENAYYRRVGASSRQIPATEWKEFLLAGNRRQFP